MKKLSIGIQTFSELISEKYVYVDKTKIIHHLITQGKVYFLSRPRRFGKSLLISTMQAIFEGKRELFSGLAIDSLEYDWRARPIIHLSFSSIPHKTPSQLEASLCTTLKNLCMDYNLPPHDANNSSFLLIHLVKKLYTQYGPVVILIDEYDKPIIDHLHDPALAEEMRTSLREFYQLFKDLDRYLFFIFITGVSKFTQTSIFSGLNNLNDISFHPRYATLCGYTKREVETHFAPHINEWARQSGLSLTGVVNQLEMWYNGYCFSWGCEKVFNPFSVLCALDKNRFENYWIMTGAPNFLATMFKGKNPLPQLDQTLRVASNDLVITSLGQLPLVPILVQTGYLTIIGQDKIGYMLNFPNHEVSNSYAMWSLADSCNTNTPTIRSLAGELHGYLEELNFDAFFQRLIPFFASIPIDIQVEDREKYYQSVIYLICLLVGIDISVELSTNIGIIDAVIKSSTTTIIIEFKLRGTAQEALDQIKNQKYYERFLSEEKKIVLIGAQFCMKKRNIVQWIIENI